MSVSEDLINFDVIESQKENIQSLPGGRSARALAQIFSSGSKGDKFASPSPNDTKTLNDAIRQEYEAEIQASVDSDDPLDVYDRYVKWTLNAYPSAQATPESGLLPLLERATKAFLTTPHYKNDPRYLRLWLHYIRLFSDAPRETFAFLARHHVGEGLALFYEEYAAWLEGAGRWTQAEEVYKLGIEREARPVERLIRKFGEFKTRFEQRPRGSDGPSSPALPTVRPALAAKVDPFSSARTAPADSQAQRQRAGIGGGSTTRSGKPKLAVFSDADASAGSQPAVSAQSKGWESIGSLRERRKENTMEAKPWVGETLKTEKRSRPVEKMTIYRDESASDAQDESQGQRKIPDHHVREAVNPRTGRRERVFVNLEAVYPDYKNPGYEISFEELRAISRGWMQKDWSLQKKALKEISGNATSRNPPLQDYKQQSTDKALEGDMNQRLAIREKSSHQTETVELQEEPRDGKSSKARKIKVREIGETITIKTNLDSPTGPKLKRKNTSEPTMTFHTRAATDEIYSIFNQPLKSEIANTDHGDSLCESDYEDDGYTSAGESTGTGRVSAGTSEFGDDETSTLRRTNEDDEDDEDTDSVDAGEWTEFSTSKHVPKISDGEHPESTQGDNLDATEPDCVSNEPRRERFIPEMPEDYNPPVGLYRDAAMMAPNRLPFMTPIIERTENSLPSMTAARNHYDTKTPCKPVPEANHTPPGLPVGDLLGSSPVADVTELKGQDLSVDVGDFSPIPVKKLRRSPEKHGSSKNIFEKAFIIKEAQCDPTDRGIRNKILKSIDPPLASYTGYHDHSDVCGNHAADIQKFVKALKKPSRSGDKAAFNAPVLRFKGADRNYTIRRELGAGAYAPVYLAESVDSVDNDSSADNESDVVNANNKRCFSPNGSSSRWQRTMYRQDLEAIKVETDPPNAWEFYMIRIAHDRLRNSPQHSRAAESIVQAHEFHLFKNQSFLVEDYRGQGTLLDLVNIVRTEAITSTGNAEAGMDEVLAMFFAVELFRTVEGLHACGILHGDIKPDNCLVRFDDKSKASLPTPPSESLIDLEDDDAMADPSEVHYSPRGRCNWRQRGLTLIDFGRGIDMRAFQPGVQFIAEWEIGEHECNEVREMRPWTYQIDLYGVAVTIHTMLFGKYLESVPDNSRRNSSNGNGAKRYRIRESLKRYWDREIWNDVFDLLLNPGADRWVQMEQEGNNNNNNNNNNNSTILPVLNSMRYVREKMEAWLVANAEKKGLSLQIRKLEAHLSRRKEKLDREK
ncbi:hypothetical protein VTN96DRAFT_573 [Rasamsonia emersonii]